MIFTCNQEWDEMAPSASGRFCDVCSKNVHDFTSKSMKEVEKFSKGQELCGMFSLEQIEPTLVRLEIPHQKLFSRILFVTGTILGVHVTEVSGQQVAKKDSIENVQHQPNEKSYSNSAESSETVNVPELSGRNECENVTRPKRKKYYFTRRFPFIVKRISRVVGRYRL